MCATKEGSLEEDVMGEQRFLIAIVDMSGTRVLRLGSVMLHVVRTEQHIT